ncbi:neutral zinc metallopeptidase [Rhodococcus sp. SGAir0479]|uniref:neutral zinc metallopeptidase n=1 Tax=Rhodococcus sp. SGAir0479 TaxID=2567884 RepID=UPI0010CCE3D4|nr:neutral zinc metallopeptidase [Rhodococcus sp. SGAir0479]QCQ90599.1 metallopeptidase [Rhodococcus sp. SGAir0479]
MTSRVRALLALVAVVATVVTGCASTVGGRAVSIYEDPFTVAGLPAQGGPSGPRPGVPDSNRAVVGTDRGAIDTLAANAITDIESYWAGQYPTIFKGTFRPVGTLVSWNPDDPAAPEFCGFQTRDEVNAGYCTEDDAIGWDREYLLPSLVDAFGPMAAVMVLAHEYGHAVQQKAGLVGDDDPGIVFEQQADCFAGAFVRYIAEDGAAHFTLNTSDGLNSVLAATVSVRDTDPSDPESTHGSAFERVTAVQLGFTDGPSACTRIDTNEILSRRAELPQSFDGTADDGELPVTEESVRAIVASFGAVFALADPPTLDFAGADTGCADGAATEPVSYCATTNTIGVDLPALAERGRPRDSDSDAIISVDITGDYSAYVLLASRYTFAVQKASGMSLRGPRAALRAACLSGAVTAALSPGNAQTTDGSRGVWLSAGDLDEAISGLLSDGLAASDVDGNTVPSGFSRVDAFRTGVLAGQQACDGRYR